MRTVAVIPSRYGSTRLPGKPLVDICGKPMVWWVYQRICEIKEIEEVYVATDDARIYRICEEYGMPVIMTQSVHKTAANRLWEVSQQVMADFYLQINGDEPLINVDAVKAAIIQEVPQDIEFGTNIMTKVRNTAQLMDSSNIKVIFDCQMRAVYMSRIPIPYPNSTIDFDYYKHVGIIGYNKKMLDFYACSKPGRFEMIEGIDTLRFIDYGKTLQMVPVEYCESLSVDTEKDLEEVRKIILEQETKDAGRN
jgi:3-deoxy-manno-octulosonate cytidylyltransferase (CMP-KDO synthetase)